MAIDVFLVKDGVIENVAIYATLSDAQAYNQGYVVVERTEQNEQLQIGDTYA